MISVLVLGVAMLAPTVVVATETGDVSALARRLAELRGEVDSLSTQLQEKKEAYRSQLGSLAEQKTEIEVQLRREKLRIEQLSATQTRQLKKSGKQASVDSALRPVLVAAIEGLKKTVNSGIPFRVSERNSDLEKLQMQLSAGLLRSQDASHRLWQTFEDEFRLTRENGLYRQSIQLDGRYVLADVARIGMVALFFRTHNGTYGWAVRNDNGWGYLATEDRQARQQLGRLFDSFKKQVRVGFFEVPNPFGEIHPR